MRDLFVTLVIFSSLPMILMRPYVGIYMWCWISYMNPHKLSWGFAATFPFALIVAIATFIGLLSYKEDKRIPWTRETVLLLIFVLWMLLTTILALKQNLAWPEWDKVWKIQLMAFVTMMVMRERERLEKMVWVIALSIGFFGVKGGIFTITSGGGHHVLGPPDTFFGGNNEIGLAMIMVVPLMRYIQLRATKRWVRIGLGVIMALNAVAIAGTQSRGALVAGAAMLLFLILKSRRRLMLLVMVAIAVPAVISFMPATWTERMHTIKTYEEDNSAMGRINAWWFAYNLTKDRPLVGGGFNTFTRDLFERYAPNPEAVHDAHSIYFEVLGEQGYVGLAIFLLLGLFTWRTCAWVAKQAKQDAEIAWMGDLALMLQVSLVGYATGGAFLGMAYFDLYYHFVAIAVMLKVMIQDRQRAAAQLPLRPGTVAAAR